VPPINQPSKLTLNASLLPKAVMSRERKKGPNPLPRSSMTPKKAFARPRVSGNVTLTIIARSIGTDATVSTPREKPTSIITAIRVVLLTKLIMNHIGTQLRMMVLPIINGGNRGLLLYKKWPRTPPRITPTALPAPNTTKTPVAA
jgi:hypothetical protein